MRIKRGKGHGAKGMVEDRGIKFHTSLHYSRYERMRYSAYLYLTCEARSLAIRWRNRRFEKRHVAQNVLTISWRDQKYFWCSGIKWWWYKRSAKWNFFQPLLIDIQAGVYKMQIHHISSPTTWQHIFLHHNFTPNFPFTPYFRPFFSSYFANIKPCKQGVPKILYLLIF